MGYNLYTLLYVTPGGRIMQQRHSLQVGVSAPHQRAAVSFNGCEEANRLSCNCGAGTTIRLTVQNRYDTYKWGGAKVRSLVLALHLCPSSSESPMLLDCVDGMTAWLNSMH